MGPLETFLRSINCYPEHDQQRKKEKRLKNFDQKFTVPLLQPASPPPLGDNAENINVQPSSSNGFSWTPSLLTQRRPAKGKPIDLAKPEKDPKSGR